MKLHKYQEKAIKFVLDNKTVFLAMDMGLGKTVVSLKVIAKLKKPAIVFGPLNAIYNTWPSEIENWTPHLTYEILHGADKGEKLKNSKADILLINYQGIKWFFKEVKKKSFGKRILILDESSMIKSPSTQRFKLLKKMFSLWDDYRLCLSATPIPNGYHELWSQYFMLDHGIRLFESFYQYRAMYFHYTGPPVYKTTIRSKATYDQIRELIDPITYRLKAEDYLDMPEYIHNEIPVTLPEKHLKEYRRLEDDFFLEWEDAGVTAFNAAALSMKLRQYIQGAVYTDKGSGDFHKLHSVKLDVLKETLEVSPGKPVLCPIQFRFEKSMIKKALKYDVPCIAGGTNAKAAQKYIKEWNESKIPLLLCHPASIGHGVNLQTGGCTVIWFGLTWSLEYYKQLNGRLYRQGQKDTVIIHHLVMEKTIDEKIIKALKHKNATQESLLNSLRR